MKARSAVITFAAFLLILSTACGAAAISAPTAPKRGGTLRVGLYGDVVGLDPFRHGTISAVVHWNIFESLTRIKPDGSLGPALATSWEWVTDTAIRFKLRKGVKFHSGTPFNADVVKWNVEVYTNPKDPGLPYAMVGNLIDKVVVEDAYTVLFRLKTPYVPFLYMSGVNGALPMRDPVAVEKLGEGFGRNPSGTGPFKFKEWKTGEYILLERNPDWWGSKEGEGPFVDFLEFLVIPEPATRVMALETGKIDVALEIPPEDYVRLSKDKRFAAYSVPSDRVVKLDFNYDKPLWQNVNMRKAANLAIDKKGIVESLIEPLGTVSTSVITSTNFGHAPQPFPEYDPAKAKELLRKEGWAPGPDGTLAKGGKPLSIILGVPPARDLRNKEVAEAVAAMLESVGMKVTIDAQDTGAYMSVLNQPTFPFDIFFLGWGTQFLDPTHGLYNHYHSSKKPPLGLNLSRRSGEPLDSLMASEFVITDPAKRSEALAKIQKDMYDEMTCIPIWDKANVWVMGAKVKGFVPHPIFITQYLYVPVWLDR